jgi:hypothetical protein
MKVISLQFAPEATMEAMGLTSDVTNINLHHFSHLSSEVMIILR